MNRPHPLRLALWIPLACALLAIPAPAAGDDCAQCTVKALCAPHKDAEKAALEGFKAAFKDKDPERRIAALQGLADVNRGHANVRSRAAAQAMAGALRDPALEVRTEAAPLLGATQETATAVKALGATLDPLLARFEKLDLKKARGTREYTQDLLWLRALYDGLQKTGSREASPWFAKALPMKNAEVVQAAAKACGHLKHRPVIDALLVALEHLAGAEPTEETGNAWRDVCRVLPEITGNKDVKPQVDSADAPRFVRDWQDWWKANRARKEFD